MRTSEEINEVAAALAQAQGVLRPAVKDAVNPAYKSKYADLAAVWEACREALPQFGLAVIQDVANLDGDVAVTTRITHKTGQWIELGPLLVPMARPDAHGLGSAISYGKRYALSAALGVVADEDDDGNAASDAKGRAPAVASGPTWKPADAHDTGLIGTAEVGKSDADFELRKVKQDDEIHPRIAFRLTEGRSGIKVEALDTLAELIAEYRAGIEKSRVTCWGRLRDETFTPKPADGKPARPVTYQVLTLSRLKVGDIDLSEPDPEPTAPFSAEELGDIAEPVEAESVPLFPVTA